MKPSLLGISIAFLFAQLLLTPLLTGHLIKRITPLLRTKCLTELKA